MFKLFAKESVDEDIFEMGERKSKLSKAVLQDDRGAVAKGDGTPAGTGWRFFLFCVFCAAHGATLLCSNTQLVNHITISTIDTLFCNHIYSDGKKGKGRGKNKEHTGEGNEGAAAEQDPEASGAAISSILQKALMKRMQKLQQESQQ